MDSLSTSGAARSGNGKELLTNSAAGCNGLATTGGQGGFVVVRCGEQCDAVNQLEGFSIGVTADRRAAEQGELLHRRGAEVLVGTSVHTETWADETAVAEAKGQVIADRPEVLIATTGTGIRGWLSFAEARGMDADLQAVLAGTRIVARGSKAGGAVSQAGLDVADTEHSEHSEHSEQLDRLVEALIRDGVAGTVVALQLFGAPGAEAVAALETAGAGVITVPVYQWTLPHDTGAAVRLVRASLDGRLDAVTFTSRLALDHLFTVAAQEGLGDALRAAMNRDVLCACVGPVTAAAARAQGIVVDPILPERGRLGLMVRRLDEVLHDRHRHLATGGPDVVIQGSTVRAGPRQVTLTRRERAVLDILVRRPGAIIPRPVLLWEVWASGGSLHVVDITVGRLRHRLEPLGLRIGATLRRGCRLETDSSPQWSQLAPRAVGDA